MAETQHIDALLDEGRVFNPPASFAQDSNVAQWMREHGIGSAEELYQRARDPNWFWPEVAKDLVTWYKPYDKLLEWARPYAKWFVGAKYNIVHDAVDRHARSWRRNKVAYIYEGEPGDTRKVTYGELAEMVNRLANALKQLGVTKGDRVAIYMPMTPELPAAMLACAKLGAPHAVVFSGFSPVALRDRINDSGAKVVFTAAAAL
jgi:acetyl-CoA synthetase